MKIKNLRVNHVSCPVGFQIMPLSLSWTVEDSGEARGQKWARVQLFENGTEIFDSGEDTLADSVDFQIPESVTLKPRTVYTWTVTVMADNGETAQAGSYFETGKMEEPWQGQWISPENSTSSAILRK